jgi:hypothetical protein
MKRATVQKPCHGSTRIRRIARIAEIAKNAKIENPSRGWQLLDS